MNITAEMVRKYIDDKSLAWANSSLRSEMPRLMAALPNLTGDPIVLWKALADYGTYTRVTIWTRVADFYEWLIENGHAPAPNPYRVFRKKNARLFKGAYTPSLPKITFDEAKALINTIPDMEVRNHALDILHAGMRYTESLNVVDNHVIGKGNKRRRVYLNTKPAGYSGSYRTFLRTLKKYTGLKPHTLRKICASTMARPGKNRPALREADLCAVFGWASFQTAKCYIAPLQEEALASAFKAVQGGTSSAAVEVRPSVSGSSQAS